MYVCMYEYVHIYYDIVLMYVKIKTLPPDLTQLCVPEGLAQIEFFARRK